MRKHLKLYLLLSILAIFLSAWSIQTTRAAQSTNNDGGTYVESSQSSQTSSPVFETYLGSDSNAGFQNPDELNKRLDGVNLAPPIVRDATSGNVAGPIPGTESGPALSPDQPVIPVPAPASSGSEGSPAASNLSSIFSAAINLLGDWFGSLLSSMFNS